MVAGSVVAMLMTVGILVWASCWTACLFRLCCTGTAILGQFDMRTVIYYPLLVSAGSCMKLSCILHDILAPVGLRKIIHAQTNDASLHASVVHSGVTG